MAYYFATYLSIVEKGDTRKTNEKDLQNKAKHKKRATTETERTGPEILIGTNPQQLIQHKQTSRNRPEKPEQSEPKPRRLGATYTHQHLPRQCA